VATIYWPDNLPKTLLMDGLSAKRNSSVVRTQMDAGPKKARQRYTASTKTFTGRMLLNAEQHFILEYFYHNVLADGVLRFNFTDPITLELAEFRFAEDYTVNAADGLFEVSVQLERL
jgi:hypothetical protein